MTIFRITPTTSVQTTGDDDHAFDSDTPGADALIVDAGAYLDATGLGAMGASLATTGGWKVAVNGSIHSAAAHGLHLRDTAASKSTITIGANGNIAGDGGEAILLEAPATIKNSGMLRGSQYGINVQAGAQLTLTNAGTIRGGTNSIFDSDGLSNDKVTNSGTLDGTVDLSGGSNMLTNSGTILGGVSFGNQNDTIVNSGIIDGYVDLSDGTNRLTNSGTIDDSIFGEAGSDTISNSGTITGNLNLGDGNNKVTNKGIIEGNINLDNGNDSVSNTRTVLGNVNLGNGTNTLTNSGYIGGNVNGLDGRDTVKNTGTIDGKIDLGGGDDSFTGGKMQETLLDGGGSDIVKLGGGEDVYLAARTPGIDGTDMIDGGDGYDAYAAPTTTASVWINLDKIAHDFSPFAPGANPVAANTALGVDVAGTFVDTIKNFEAAYGGGGADFLYGSSGHNILSGGGGDDFLAGFAGNDQLDGGAGMDLLYGGAGRDYLIGGADADTFCFVSLSDSGISDTTRDIVADFEAGDRVDLSRIDSNIANGATDDAFAFIGTDLAFTGVAGQLRAYLTADGQIVEGDVDGDGHADFSIELLDPAHAYTLTNTDFVL
jgi:hypothetical protein